MQIYKTKFMGFIVRMVQRDGLEPVIPVVDIASSIGYSIQPILRIIRNNDDVLEDALVIVTIINAYTQKHGSGTEYEMKRKRKHHCLSRDGILLILMSLAHKRIKNTEKRQTVIEFKKWAIKTLGEVLDGKTPSNLVIEEIADLLQIKGGYRRGDAVRLLASARGVTPHHIYKLLNRFNGGPLINYNFSRPPKYPAEVAKILAYKKTHPQAGGTEIKRELSLTYSKNRINNILLERKN